MERKEDIGKLLKKRLEAVKSTPGPDLWDRVSDSLDRGDRRKRRFIYYWFTGAGLALLLLLMLLNTETNFFEDSKELTPKESIQISEDAEATDTSVSSSEETKITKDGTIEKEKNSNTTEATVETGRDKRSEVKPKDEPAVTKAANNDKTSELPTKSGTLDTNPNTRVKTSKDITIKTNDAALQVETSNSGVKSTINKGREATAIGTTQSANGSTTPKTVENGTTTKIVEDVITPKTTKKTAVATTEASVGSKTPKATEEGSGKSEVNQDLLSTNSKDIEAENTEVSKVPISAKDSLLSKRMALRDSLLKGRIALKDSVRKQRTLLRDSLLKARLERKDSLLKERLAVKDSLKPTGVEKDSSVVEEIAKPEYIWDFSVIGAPSYFGISNSGSAIDGQFEGADKTGSFGISYGVTVNLPILERYTLSFGALKTRFSNSTNNIATTTAEERSQILSFTETEFNTFNGFLGNDETVTILQDIEYVEMPFHVKYRLGGMKLGFHVYGGFSTYILLNDEVMARNTAGENLSLGRASRLSPINVSIDGGFGFYYNFTETLGLEINPTYKYHLNTVTAQSFNARTYSMGVFSGLRYKF